MSPQNQSITLREEKTGKSANKKNAVKFNDRLKLEHLENLASWAAGEANIPCLAAFYGRRLAAVRESLGVPPNHSSSLFQCERCETVLRPGTNCTVAAKKNKANEKSGLSYQVYSCRFCSHGNLKRETSKQQRHSKETRVHGNDPELSTTESNPPMPNQVPSQVLDEPVGPETPSKLGADGPAMILFVESGPTLSDAKKIELSTLESNPPPMASEIEEKLSRVVAESETDGPTTTPGVGPGRTLLDTKKRKRKKPSGKKTAGPGNGGNAETAMSNGKSRANEKPIPFTL